MRAEPGAERLLIEVCDAVDYEIGVDADAVLSPDDGKLDSTHGWASRVRLLAGLGIEAATAERLRASGPLVPGEVVVTSAGDLHCTWIVHAAVLDEASHLKAVPFATAVATAIRMGLDRPWRTLDVLVPECRAERRRRKVVDALSRIWDEVTTPVSGQLRVRFIVAASSLADDLHALFAATPRSESRRPSRPLDTRLTASSDGMPTEAAPVLVPVKEEITDANEWTGATDVSAPPPEMLEDTRPRLRRDTVPEAGTLLEAASPEPSRRKDRPEGEALLEATSLEPLASLTQEEQDRLVEHLEECACLQSPEGRQSVRGRLPKDIHIRVADASGMRIVLTGLVKHSVAYPGGLASLYQAVHWFEGETFAMRRLSDLLRGFLEQRSR